MIRIPKQYFVVALSFVFATADNILATPVDSSLIKNLKQHIYYLASDKLKGRNTGSKGEQEAYEYIIAQYKKIGIVPKGETGFLQSFTFNYGRKLYGKNESLINGVALQLNEDFYPINSSSNGTAKARISDVGFGLIAPDIQYDSYKSLPDLKGTIFLIECSTPDGDSPHSPYAPYADIQTRIENARKKGAIGIIFTNTQLKAEDLKANLDINTYAAEIPIVFIKSTALKKWLRTEFNSAEITTHLEKIELTGHNIAGFIDNGASSTIVIGAHFDHLGSGEYGNSLYRGPEAVHNGADDNASGTAGVIELARYLKTNNIREQNNYLFLNFSGEELGLIGSNYWINHPTYDTSKINFMINMDMIGRLDTSKGIEVSGLGTSPEAFNFIRSLPVDQLKLKLGENGTGPTDHTSFYYANIPVLNFFTGTHEDYHKPSDDADKINYSGEAEILHLIEKIISTLDDDGTIPFFKTKESDGSDIPQFKVRLGLIPDYLYEGPGLRVDGVDEGKPAANAGIQKGDIILEIGDYQVGDIMAYMKALSGFEKGDETTVTVKRENSSLQLKVVF